MKLVKGPSSPGMLDLNLLYWSGSSNSMAGMALSIHKDKSLRNWLSILGQELAKDSLLQVPRITCRPLVFYFIP
jgi:hypothetical protein